MYKRYTRDLYSRFPALNQQKVVIERRFRRFLRLPTESDHRLFRFFAGLEGVCFVDIGANVGQTIDAIRMHGWECEVHSFEPNPILATTLRETYAGDASLTVHNVALSDQSGQMSLVIPYYRKMAFHGLASLDEENITGWLSADFIAFYDRRKLSMVTEKVQVRTLDSFSLDPYFIKVDVQGFEYEVLKGGMQTIERSRPIIMLETPQENRETRLLKSWGYRIFRFDRNRLVEGGRGSLNTFFIAEEKVDDLPAGLVVAG